jgi:hypothetical protein
MMLIVAGASTSCCSVLDADTTTSSFRVAFGSSGGFWSGFGAGVGVGVGFGGGCWPVA